MEKRVLVVDDDEDIRRLLGAALTDKQYQVSCVANAEDALEQQRGSSFPLQFIDLQLPGMSGLELCRRIREDDAASILVAITAHTSLFQVVDAREAGFDDLYYKPFDSRVVVQAAADAFERIERWRRLT